MGAGRKTITHHLKEKGLPSATTNASAPARNLPKKDLAGVIFGCKNYTISECHAKMLFGLPSPHFAYVKNIHPGLPLFLFNYSDRNLHGTYEAASYGKMNIDQYAWTTKAREETLYGAQVKIKDRMPCLPLSEEEFGPIIHANYYEPKLFWFELDTAQTDKLIKMFKSRTCISRPLFPPPAKGQTRNKNAEAQTSRTAPAPIDFVNDEWGGSWSGVETSYPPTPSLSERTWSSLFKSSTSVGSQAIQAPIGSYEAPIGSGGGNDGNLPGKDCAPASENWSSSLRTILHSDRDGKSESVADDKPLETEENTEVSYCSGVEIDIIDDQEEESTGLPTMAVEPYWRNNSSSEIVETADVVPSGIQALVVKLMAEIEALRASHQMISGELIESKAEIQMLKSRFHKLESGSYTEARQEINDAIFIIGGFDGSSWLPDLCSYLPSEDILKSLSPMSIVRKYSSAVTLNGEVYILGGQYDSLWQDTVESYNPVTDKWSNRPSLKRPKGSLAGVPLFDKIYAIGGGNGKYCFSDVEMLDFDVGKWIPTRSMAHKRFDPAAAELNGVMYVVGGYDGESYLSSAERFDPREHSWKSLPSMGTKRGCHSLISLNDKLYAIGGHNGIDMVSSVEIFEPRKVSWMMGPPMTIPRGYFGAAVFEEKIHLIGGITEDKQILETIEVYKEGRGWEMTELKAVGKRCYLSALVL